VGEGKVYLTEGMRVYLKTFEGVAIAIEFPQKVTVEIAETEPVMKGQTASSSYKPAVCTNGLRIMVPPHIGAGTRVIISTEDNAYVERARD
jgi:elongation factor P